MYPLRTILCLVYFEKDVSTGKLFLTSAADIQVLPPTFRLLQRRSRCRSCPDRVVSAMFHNFKREEVIYIPRRQCGTGRQSFCSSECV